MKENACENGVWKMASNCIGLNVLNVYVNDFIKTILNMAAYGRQS